MLDLGLNDGHHSMVVLCGGLDGSRPTCASGFTDVEFTQDAHDKDVYWVHSTGKDVGDDWDVFFDRDTGLDAEEVVLNSELHGSFRRNDDGAVVFSGVFEYVGSTGEDNVPVTRVVNLEDVLVQEDDAHIWATDMSNDCYLAIV